MAYHEPHAEWLLLIHSDHPNTHTNHTQTNLPTDKQTRILSMMLAISQTGKHSENTWAPEQPAYVGRTVFDTN